MRRRQPLKVVRHRARRAAVPAALGKGVGGALLCDEEYPPFDGPYQNRTYGRRLSLQTVRGFWKKTLRLIARGRAPAGIGLYLHWPFCRSRCAYCYCDARVPRPAAETERCLKSLIREMEAFRAVFRGAGFDSLILAGGTPTAASAGQLARLLAAAAKRFTLRPGADIAVEASPATLSAAKIKLLSARGVRRVDLGVDTLDPAVLALAGRGRQSRALVGDVCRAVARTGTITLDIGLLYGLEGQTGASFMRDLLWVLRCGPSTIRLYGFDPRPQTRFTRSGKTLPPRRRREIGAVLGLADKVMRRAGYGSSARRWQVPASVLGIGPSAKSRAFGAGCYQHAPLAETKTTPASIPPFFGMPLTLTDERRGCVISSLAATGRLSRRAFVDLFGEDIMKSGPLARAVHELKSVNLLRVSRDDIRLGTAGAAARNLALRRLYGGKLRRELRKAGVMAANGGPAAFGPDCRVYHAGGGRP